MSVQPSTSPDKKVPPQTDPVDLAQAPLSPAPKLSTINQALEIASDKSITLLERLRALSDLLPRALPHGAEPSSENRVVALGVLSCVTKSSALAPFPRAQREFSEIVVDTVSHAALLVLPDSSPEELSLVADAILNIDRLSKDATKETVARALSLSESAPTDVLAKVLCAASPSKAESNDLWSLASAVLARPETLPSDILVRCAEKLCSCYGTVPQHAEALSAEFLRRMGDESFSLVCDFSDSMYTLCRQKPESLLSSHSPGSYSQLCEIHTSWRDALASRADELAPRLLLIRDAFKRLGIEGKRSATRALGELEQLFCRDKNSLSTKDAVSLAIATCRILYRSEDLCSAIARRCEAEAESLSDKDFASVARALGRLGFRDLKFISRMSDEACKRFDTLKPHHALHITSALFNLQALQPRVAEAALRHTLANRDQYLESDYALMLWCLSSVLPDQVGKLCSAEDLSAIGESGAWLRTFQTLISCGKFVNFDLQDREIDRKLRRECAFNTSRLERAVLDSLSRNLRDLPLEFMLNPLVAGIEVDILIKSPARQFVIEIDGHRYHSLFGPDANQLLFGLDVTQETVLQRLGYTVFHINTADLTIGKRQQSSVDRLAATIRAKVLNDAARTTPSVALRYPFSPGSPTRSPLPGSATNKPAEKKPSSESLA